MMRIGDPNLRIRADAGFAAQHEGGNPGQIALERDRHQVKHELRMLFEHLWNAHRLLYHRQLLADLLLSLMDAPLNIAHCLEILTNPRPVARAEPLLEKGNL